MQFYNFLAKTVRERKHNETKFQDENFHCIAVNVVNVIVVKRAI
jgi:hypothetical protein